MSSRTWVQPPLPLEPPKVRAHAEAAESQLPWPQAGRVILFLSLSMWAAIWKLGTLLF